MYKVFVVEDEQIVREGIRNKIDWEQTKYRLCGEAADGEMALSMISELRPDIIITDIRMPFMGGLELSRVVRHTMPYVRIIILSGHDEFAYAKEAISIGVDEYLLKPINSSQILSALDKVTKVIEEEKQKQLNNRRLQIELKSIEEFKRNRFFEELVLGEIGTSEAIEIACSEGIDIIAHSYIMLDVEIDISDQFSKKICSAQNYVEKLFKDRQDIIWFFRGYDRLVILIKGDNSSDLTETSYGIAQTLKYELERNIDIHLSIGIGSPVERIGEIAKSYSDAHNVHKYMGQLHHGQIISIGDIEDKEIGYSFLKEADNSIRESIRYLRSKDVDSFVEKLERKIISTDGQNTFIGCYILMDFVMSCVRLITEIGGDCTSILEQVDSLKNIFEIASSQEQFENFTKAILKKVIGIRDDSQNLKYGTVINKARRFIEDNYGDSSISLITVANEVNLSPNHFSTVFSQEMGETFIEYLTKVRIEKAKEYLSDPSYKSPEIAYAVGYNESHYFNYLFKKHTGLTPREYRNQIKKE
ncbi:MAG TPA: DNA-binding response regulator [Clostridiaceae bacterium]|nr:DNA-binding response regulator [Clostridiaceae bacterium]